MTISLVINCDNRDGYLNDSSFVGEYGSGSLQGVRSSELLTFGLLNKIKFFDGYNIQCIFYLDEHSPLSEKLFMEIDEIVKSCGNNSKFICKSHNRTKYKWNDYIYLEALRLADGDFVVHFDGDCSAYKKEGSDIVERYFKWLDEGYKYVCQSWDGTGDKMYWSSTRFFICKKETLEFDKIEQNFYVNPLMGKNNPCFESTIGIMAGEGKVLYPEREDDDYIIFCWSRYFKGTLEKLSKMPYDEVKGYILECGLFGCNDVFDKIPAES